MRVSSSYFNNLMLRAMQNSSASLARTTNQLSTNKRLLQPSDDAVDTVKLLHLENELSTIIQYKDNIKSSKSVLQQQDALYSGMNDLLFKARELMLEAGSSTLNQADRDAKADELDAINLSLLALANDQKADGQYRFSGTLSTEKPVSLSGTHYTYNGNSLKSVVNISGSAQVVINQPGDELFFDATTPAGHGSIFDAIKGAAEELRSPTNLELTVQNTLSWIDQSLDRVGKAQTLGGSNMALLERVHESHSDIELMANQLKSDLGDVDMVEATTRLNQQQLILSVTQQVYSSISKLSLFNYF